MKINIPLFLSGALFFAFFLLFSFLVHKDVFTHLDFDTTVRLQDNISRRFDEFFSMFSIIGNFEVLTIVLIMLLVFLRKILAGIVLFGGYVMFHVIELFGKIFIEHYPPPEFLLRTDKPIDFPQFHVRSEFAYPSGHSGRTVFLSVILIFLILRSRHLPQAVKVVAIATVLSFDAVMLLSRIYLGEHWLSDVVGGTLLALGISLMGISFAGPARGSARKETVHL